MIPLKEGYKYLCRCGLVVTLQRAGSPIAPWTAIHAYWDSDPERLALFCSEQWTNEGYARFNSALDIIAEG